jgi:hypothetical protein
MSNLNHYYHYHNNATYDMNRSLDRSDLNNVGKLDITDLKATFKTYEQKRY